MSASYWTTIHIKGTGEELQAMFRVLKTWQTVRQEQFRQTKDCAYLADIYVKGTKNSMGCECSPWTDRVDEQISALLKPAENDISVTADGPWGAFDNVMETGLFEALAEAAPGAWVQGNIDGEYPGMDEMLFVRLEDGELDLTAHIMPDDDWPDVTCENRIYDPVTKQIKSTKKWKYRDEADEEDTEG